MFSMSLPCTNSIFYVRSPDRWWSPGPIHLYHADYLYMYITCMYKLSMKILFDMIAIWHKKLWVAFNKWGRIRWWKFSFSVFNKDRWRRNLTISFFSMLLWQPRPLDLNQSISTITLDAAYSQKIQVIGWVHWGINTCDFS